MLHSSLDSEFSFYLGVLVALIDHFANLILSVSTLNLALSMSAATAVLIDPTTTNLFLSSQLA